MGSSYNFFSGDLKEMVELIVQAKSKPIKLTDDIVPRVMPFPTNLSRLMVHDYTFNILLIEYVFIYQSL